MFVVPKGVEHKPFAERFHRLFPDRPGSSLRAALMLLDEGHHLAAPRELVESFGAPR